MLCKKFCLTCVFALFSSVFLGIALAQSNENWDDSFASGPSNMLISADSISDQIITGGFSFFIDGAFFPYIAKWDQSDMSWSGLGSGLDDPVNSVHIAGASVYVGGLFDTAGGMPASRIAVYSLSDNTWSPLGTGVTNFGGGTPPVVYSIESIGSEVFVGGIFDMAGGVPVSEIAVWDSIDKTWSSLGGGIEGYIMAMASADDDLYVGGVIVSASGIPVSHVARWDNLSKSWSSLDNGVGSVGDIVRDMVVVGNELYVCGSGFDSASGVPLGGPQARWNFETEQWSSVGPGFLRATYSLTADDEFVYAGFSSTGGDPNVLRWNIEAETWDALGSGVLGDPLDMVINPNGLYVVGNFESAGGKPSENFARYIPNLSFGVQNWDFYK